MSKWEMVRLGDVFSQQISGEWGLEAERDIDSVPVLRTTNFTNLGVINYNSIAYRKIDHQKVCAKKLQYGDIIIEKSGGTENIPVGRVVFCGVEIEEKTYMCNNFTQALRPKTSYVEPKYIFYYMFKMHKMGMTGLMQNKTTGIRNLQVKRYLDTKLQLPPLEVQKQIADELDKIADVIEKRKAQIEKLDLLVKAKFVEMFGDPVRNENNYDFVKFNEIIEYMGDIGSNGANAVVTKNLNMKDIEDYALMVRFLNFTSNDFINNTKYISEDSYNFFSKSKLYGGELIFCKIGSAGENYIMPYLDRPVSLGLNQIMTKVSNRISVKYLYEYINSKYGKQLIESCINGAVTKSITKTALKQIPIMLPSIDRQNQFAEYVEKVEKSKEDMRKGLERLEMLYKERMQEYFG